MRLDLIGHWINNGKRRASVLATIEMPFVPFVGLQLSLADGPHLKIEEVCWDHAVSVLSAGGHCDLEWPEEMFDGFVADLRGAGYDVEEFDEESP